MPSLTFFNNNDIRLVDLETQKFQLPDAHFESNGDNQGGTVTVTLKNLSILEKKGTDTVKGVKRNLALNFV